MACSFNSANVYLQGISIRPLIEFINVRRTNRNLDTINVEIHCRVSRRRWCSKYDLMCFRAVLTCLTLLSAHGAHHSWHRGPLWTVEPPLLEGQVRQRQFIVIQTGLSAVELKRGGTFRPQFLSAWFRLTVLLFAVCGSRDSQSDQSWFS